MKLQAVLFDLDRTLSDRDTAFRRFAHSQFRSFRSALVNTTEVEFVATLVRLDERGMVSKDKVYREIEKRFALRGVTAQELYVDFEARIADFYVTFPQAHETLQALRAQRLRLGLVSNGRTDFQRRKLRVLELEPYFDAILISEAEGLRKPDPAIFRRACDRLQVLPDRALFVGDNVAADIEGARRANLLTAWKREPGYQGRAVSDFDFDGIPEILDWVDKIEISDGGSTGSECDGRRQK